jgi:hypothetical protein
LEYPIRTFVSVGNIWNILIIFSLLILSKTGFILTTIKNREYQHLPFHSKCFTEQIIGLCNFYILVDIDYKFVNRLDLVGVGWESSN